MKRKWIRARLGALRALRALAGVAALVAGTSACGNVTSGGFGEVEVLLSADSVADFSRAVLASGPLASTGDVLQGTMTVTVRSYIRQGRLRWVEITDGPQELTLSLDDPTPVLVARAELPEGEYEAIRTVFGRVRVQVERGLTAGGVPFTGELRVPVGVGGILVAEERGIRVEEGRPLPLLLELRARRWLPLVDRDRREVTEADFVREVRVRTPPGR